MAESQVKSREAKVSFDEDVSEGLPALHICLIPDGHGREDYRTVALVEVTFFTKRDSAMVSDEEMPGFLSALQQLGITLDTYNGAYNNVNHPNASDSTIQFNNSLEQSPKRQRMDNGAATSTK